MRRRIYIDPEGPLSDNTRQPYLWTEHDVPTDGEPLDMCRTGALYDDALWRQYQAAEAEASRLRLLVCEALTAEPYDAVEIVLSHRARKLMDEDDYSPEAMDQLADEAEANARRKADP